MKTFIHLYSSIVNQRISPKLISENGKIRRVMELKHEDCNAPWYLDDATFFEDKCGIRPLKREGVAQQSSPGLQA